MEHECPRGNLAVESGAEPSGDEVAARLGLSGRRRRMVEQAMQALAAACQWGVDPDDGPRGEEVAAPAGDPGAGLQVEEERLWLRGALGGLDERSRAILVMRHGLDGGEIKTLREVGQRVGATREWVDR